MQTCESGESLMSPGKKKDIERNYSDETFYTDSSEDLRSKCKSAATLLQKRRQLRPINGSGNPYLSGTRLTAITSPSKNNVSMISQKIMSAKLLRVKQLQNELTDAHFQLNELSTENRILRTLQKRQDMALKKYEGTQAELPQLIRSHNEEIRALKAKLKQVKGQCRDMENRLKVRESELAALREQHKHLLKLSKDKHLGEREQLQLQLDQMQEILKDQDKKVQMLTRKAMLEGKNLKHQLTTEVARHKKTTKELDIALERVAQLESILETKEKYIAINMGRGHSFQSSSVVSFGNPSRLRIPTFAQANDSDGASTGIGDSGLERVGGGGGGGCVTTATTAEAETESEDVSASMKMAAILQAATPLRSCRQNQRRLQRQCVQLGPDDDLDDDDEEEEDDDYARPPLSRESLRFLDHNSAGGFDDELRQQGSNTCPSQVSTTESVENLSKDTAENFHGDDVKLDSSARAAQNPDLLSEYGLDSESSLLNARPALRRYSISGECTFVSPDPPPASAAALSARRGSLNGAGDGDGGGGGAKKEKSESQEKSKAASAQKEPPPPSSSSSVERKKSVDALDGNDSTEENALKEMSVEEGRLHLKTINRTWNDIQSRIKDETKRTQSMIDKFDEDVDLGKYLGTAASRRADAAAAAFDKNNLLAALKAIDEGNDMDFGEAMERRGSNALQCKSKKVEYRTPNQTIEHLHRGIPTRSNVSVPVVEKPRKEHNIFWDGNTSEQIFK